MTIPYTRSFEEIEYKNGVVYGDGELIAYYNSNPFFNENGYDPRIGSKTVLFKNGNAYIL